MKQHESETTIDGLAPPEIKRIISIVDLGPKNLEKVTPQNVRGIIENGAAQIADRRKQIQNFTPDYSVAEVVSLKETRGNNYAHAIQCGINPTMDAAGYLNFLDAKQFPPGNSDAQYLKDFFTANAALNNLLAETYKIDIARRIGQAKNDPQFFEQEMNALKKITADILESLAKFEGKNKAGIAALPDEERLPIVTAMAELRRALANPDFNSLKDNFYDSVCQSLSRVIGDDYMVLNKEAISAAALRLGKLELTDTDRTQLKERVLANVSPNEQTLAAFIFDHGFTSIPAQRQDTDEEYYEIEDNACRLLIFNHDAARDFVTHSELFSTLLYYDKLSRLAIRGNIKI